MEEILKNINFALVDKKQKGGIKNRGWHKKKQGG